MLLYVMESLLYRRHENKKKDHKGECQTTNSNSEEEGRRQEQEGLPACHHPRCTRLLLRLTPMLSNFLVQKLQCILINSPPSLVNSGTNFLRFPFLHFYKTSNSIIGE